MIKTHTTHQRQARKRRIRARIHGTATKPRLTVYRSLKHFYAQLIDDDQHRTLVFVSNVKTKDPDLAALGQQLATQAKAKNIKTVVFDRNGYLYHGKVKAFADAARAHGLQF